LSTSISHETTVSSSKFSQLLGRDVKLRGYRPSASDFMATLRRRQPRSFTSHNAWQKETRLLALYCTDPDATNSDLLRALNVRRPTLRSMFKHYGLDYERRDFAAKEVQNG
jgi:phosphatidylethanolamine-binding protein (PEBP) family uncharacterized protein